MKETDEKEERKREREIWSYYWFKYFKNAIKWKKNESKYIY